MRTWHRNLYLPKDYIEQEASARQSHQSSSLWPICPVCTKREHAPIEVTAYGVKDFGKLPGVTGEHYTDFYARCHGQEDIIRIEGFRWDKMDEDDLVTRLAAIKALPFFYKMDSGCRCIPLSTMLNFMATNRGATL